MDQNDDLKRVRCREAGCGETIYVGDPPRTFEEREAFGWAVERATRQHYPKRHLGRWIEFKHWLGDAGEKARSEEAALQEANPHKLYQDLKASVGGW